MIQARDMPMAVLLQVTKILEVSSGAKTAVQVVWMQCLLRLRSSERPDLVPDIW